MQQIVEFVKTIESYPIVIVAIVVLIVLAMCIFCTWVYAIVKLFTKK